MALRSLVRSLLLALAVVQVALGVAVIENRQSTDKFVFAHLIVGIVSDRASASDWDADMIAAKAIGIDAFALDIGTDSFTNTQLGYAYESAANNGMGVFISFDFSYWSTGDPTGVGQMIAQWAGVAGQFKVGDAVMVSSFVGDGLDVATVRSTAGVDIYFAPNFQPGDFSQVDGALSWLAWPNNGANGPPPPGGPVDTVQDGDNSYVASLSSSQGYIAPASPWFATHYGPEVSYSKNWIFPSDLLFYERWQEILNLQPAFVEIVTWNDYGESHYIGPLSSKHYDDGASKWAQDMPHDGWQDLAKPFIAAYKAGSTDVSSFITEDQIVYWYRPTPKDIDCSSTDNVGSPPTGYDLMSDSVFVVPLLTSAGTVLVNSGGTLYELDAPAGVSAYEVPFELGIQGFELQRNGASVMSATALRPIVDTCPCGVYNFNAFVGVVPPPSTVDVLGSDGLSSVTVGVHGSFCSPTPTFTTTPGATTDASTTITATPAITTPPVRRR